MTSLEWIFTGAIFALLGGAMLYDKLWIQRERKSSRRFVVRCRRGYYGPTPGQGYCGNSGDLPIKKAYRYTRREARELAMNLGAEVEELRA